MARGSSTSTCRNGVFRPWSRGGREISLAPNAEEGGGAIAGQIGIDLYWLPLGAGGNFVRLNGRVYEAIAAGIQRRPRFDLYHSGLQVFAPEGRYVIEQTPAAAGGEERGVVGVGPIGSRWLARHYPMFRYELRRWRGGVIPDVAEAVDSPRRLSDDLSDARRLLALVPEVPFLLWGRDELGAGEMWNSNSQISWLLARAGFDAASIRPPEGGRAPGWGAGLLAAAAGLRREALRGPIGESAAASRGGA